MRNYTLNSRGDGKWLSTYLYFLLFTGRMPVAQSEYLSTSVNSWIIHGYILNRIY